MELGNGKAVELTLHVVVPVPADRFFTSHGIELFSSSNFIASPLFCFSLAYCNSRWIFTSRNTDDQAGDNPLLFKHTNELLLGVASTSVSANLAEPFCKNNLLVPKPNVVR